MGQDIANVANFQLLSFAGDQQLDVASQGWSPENQSNIYPRQDTNYAGGAGFKFSDRFIEDGSFIRIQNITVGYRFSETIISPIGLTFLKIYAILWTLLRPRYLKIWK